MRTIVAASFIVAVSLGAAASAQQPDSPVLVGFVRAALQKSQQQSWPIGPPLPPWMAPRPTRLGILTLASPDTNGEMVKVIVPVGNLVSRAAQVVSSAQHRRAERKSHEEVVRALRDFQAQRAEP